MNGSIEYRIVRGIREYFSSELVSVVLFGSQARGTADEHSDIDLVVIAEGIPSDWREEREILSKLALSSGLAGLPVAIILKSPEVVKASLDTIQPLLFGILKGYRVLYDPEGFFDICLSGSKWLVV